MTMSNCPLPDDLTKEDRDARKEAFKRLQEFVTSDESGALDIGIREPGIRDGLDCAFCDHEMSVMLALADMRTGSCICHGCLDKLRGSITPLGRAPDRPDLN